MIVFLCIWLLIQGDGFPIPIVISSKSNIRSFLIQASEYFQKQNWFSFQIRVFKVEIISSEIEAE